jgi:hypothetical protein
VPTTTSSLSSSPPATNATATAATTTATTPVTTAHPLLATRRDSTTQVRLPLGWYSCSYLGLTIVSPEFDLCLFSSGATDRRSRASLRRSRSLDRLTLLTISVLPYKRWDSTLIRHGRFLLLYVICNSLFITMP